MSVGIERFRGKITDEQFEDMKWLADTIKDQTVGQLLWGYCAAIAVEHQDWTLWQILDEAKNSFKVERKHIV